MHIYAYTVHARAYTRVSCVHTRACIHAETRNEYNCSVLGTRSRATMRNDLKFIGMHVNYFNYYTAVKG